MNHIENFTVAPQSQKTALFVGLFLGAFFGFVGSVAYTKYILRADTVQTDIKTIHIKYIDGRTATVVVNKEAKE